MGCTSSILSDRRTNPSENNHRLQKNSRSLFCVKNINRNSSDFTQTAHGIMEQILETDPLNQALINPYQKTTDTNDEKEKVSEIVIYFHHDKMNRNEKYKCYFSYILFF